MVQRTSSRPTRLEDVAEAAGVHVSTVSRVLNGGSEAAVRPETRLRIEEAATRLRYRPNAMARGLKLASAGALGLLVPSLRNPVYSAIIRGAFDRAWERDFVVLLAEDIGASSAQQAYERLVEEGRIDGLLIASARPGSPLFDHLIDDPIPCVFVNRRHLGSGRNAAMREEDAGRLAAEHLLGLGHTRLAHISGPTELDTARRRADGFARAVRTAGHRCTIVPAPFDEPGGMAAMRELLVRRTPPTGVFASNINQAVGAIAGVRLAGRSIPADLSLVGYDDDPLCDCLEVPLTAIRMPLSELGRVAVDALIDQVEGAAPCDITVETPPELVVRGIDRTAEGRMNIRAAVMEHAKAPLVLGEVELDEPRRDEVLVRILATGICRSDLSFMDGKWPSPLPIVLGHEGAAVIEAVGEGVDDSRVGERVVLTFAPPCGRCRFCLEGRANLCLEAAACMDAGTMRDGTTRLHRGDERVHHLALVSSFADHAVVPANAAIPVTDRLEPGLACLLGCGVTTGVMSVTRRANVRPGESVAVFGCGGVGLAAVLGAGLVSAQPVIAVDPLPDKRAMALDLGATHAVDPGAGDPAEQIRAIVPGGVDHAFEAIGIAEVADQAFRSVRDGGTTVLIGQPAIGVKAGFDVYNATQFEHTILGSNLGGANPALHVPGLARLAESGRLELTSLVTHRMPLEQINEACEITASGAGGRVVIEL